MINLEQFIPEVEQIRNQYRHDIESELLVHRSKLLEIMGIFFGVEWDSQGERIEKNNTLESEEMDNFIPYYEKIDEIGLKDVSLLSINELRADIGELVRIFYNLREEMLSEAEEEVVRDEEIINDDEEVL